MSSKEVLMPDPNSSTRRAFYCQESLWQTFSDLAIKRGCSVDVLINEAMTSYLQNMPMQQQPMQRQPMQPQQANSFSRQPAPSPMGNPPMPQRQSIPAAQPASPYARAQAPGIQPAQAPYRSAGSIPPAPLSMPAGPRVPPPTPASYKRPPSIFEEPVSEQVGAGGKPMVLASLNTPSQNPAGVIQQPSNFAQRQQQQQNYGQQPLYIIFANQRYAVDKDKYIIGRSSQMADLVIRDGNISRKHCAIIFKNGAYYIKDLDSTNGIEFQGNRIDTKRIEEGDQFNICEFQFTFTYR